MLKASNFENFKPRNPYKGNGAPKNAPKEAANVPSEAKPTDTATPEKLADANPTNAKDAYKVDLSEEAKSKSSSSSKLTDKLTDLKAPDLNTPNLDKSDLKPKPTDALRPGLFGRKKDKDKEKDTQESKEANKVEHEKKGYLKKPGIFFISGMEIFSRSSSGRYDGIRKMAESISGARVYNWDQKDEMLTEIKKLHVDQPVIVVGHSFGGDTAHEIAEDLNEVENGFRKIDLLVTIDSVGYDNNIIPENVKRNINIFGEKDFLLNDGPHAARNADKTKIYNIVRAEAHTDLDDTKEVQTQIIDAIQDILRDKVSEKIEKVVDKVKDVFDGKDNKDKEPLKESKTVTIEVKA